MKIRITNQTPRMTNLGLRKGMLFDATKREELKLVKSELEREGAGAKKEKKSKS